MFNLAPAIGSVNAVRLNYNFTMIPGEQSSFGSCEMIVSNRKAQPPERARGQIARTYKYMEWAYPKYSMSHQQRQLMNAWDKMYPVSGWECTRATRIEALQGNRNPFVSDNCSSAQEQGASVLLRPAPSGPDENKATSIFGEIYHGNRQARSFMHQVVVIITVKAVWLSLPPVKMLSRQGISLVGDVGRRYGAILL